MIETAERYFAEVLERLSGLRQSQAQAIERVASALVDAARADRLVYVIGTGHSHMLAEEVHYLDGGLAFAVPILTAATMLHEGAVAGTRYERMGGFVGPILDRYEIGPGDVLIVSSNSGVNAAPIEAAEIGRERGALIVAITSVAYSSAVANGRTRLADLADIVLDNGAPPGDAVLDLEGSDLRVGPVSTVVGVTLLNAIFAEAAARLASDGEAPIYLSANMAGAADNNEKLVQRYRRRNPHL
jgi:uncharacterized phosphosugar-binding protein